MNDHLDAKSKEASTHDRPTNYPRARQIAVIDDELDRDHGGGLAPSRSKVVSRLRE
jgi:hypothetical protein